MEPLAVIMLVGGRFRVKERQLETENQGIPKKKKRREREEKRHEKTCVLFYREVTVCKEFTQS